MSSYLRDTTLVQRVNPYRRVWLFLLPLYLIMASAGIAYFVHLINFSIKSHVSKLCPFIAILICISIGITGIRTQSVIYANSSSETLLDAKQITPGLKQLLRTGDALVTICPSNYPLMFYFYENNISLDYFYFNTNIKNTERIILILSKNRETDTIPYLMEKTGIPPDDFKPPYVL